METIKINETMKKKIVAFCVDELDWHINNCNAEDYKDETEAEIFLLKSLGREDEAKRFKQAYKAATKDTKEALNILHEMSDRDVVETFIDDNLRDFVGYDCYEDTDGYDLRHAWSEMEEYLDSLSEDKMKDLAKGIRKSQDKYYCEDRMVKKAS